MKKSAGGILWTLLFILSLTDRAAVAQDRGEPPAGTAFVKPGVASVFTLPENWPKNNDAPPSNRAPGGAKSFALVLGSGTPGPNPYRMGASFAVISNGYPYFVDCGEGVWRSMASSCLAQGDWLTRAFALDNLKYLFLTHLHCDHTVGIPSWVLNAYKFGSKAGKEIYGPKGTEEMMRNMMAAWKLDMEDMWYGPTKSSKEGVTVSAHDFDDDGLVFQDANVKVFAYRKYHGYLKDNFAYRFECADGRVLVFAGDGWTCPGLIQASKNADVVFVEAFSKEDLAYTPWGNAKDAELGRLEYVTHAYHMWPEELALMQKESGVKAVVLVHQQDYAPAQKYGRLNLLQECKRAGVKDPLYSAVDGDIY